MDEQVIIWISMQMWSCFMWLFQNTKWDFFQTSRKDLGKVTVTKYFPILTIPSLSSQVLNKAKWKLDYNRACY